MVLIQCIYINAIYDLAAILFFGGHLGFYRHIEMKYYFWYFIGWYL